MHRVLGTFHFFCRSGTTVVGACLFLPKWHLCRRGVPRARPLTTAKRVGSLVTGNMCMESESGQFDEGEKIEQELSAHKIRPKSAKQGGSRLPWSALQQRLMASEWEMRFEAHSYGFRPGRGVHDAIAAILVAIERHPTFVL